MTTELAFLSASSVTELSQKENAALVVFMTDTLKPLTTVLSADDVAALTTLAEAAKFSGQLAETCSSVQMNVAGFTHVMLVGVGKENWSAVNGSQLQKLANTVYKTLQKQSETASVLLDTDLSSDQFMQLSLALLNASYRFDEYKSKKTAPTLTHVEFVSATDFANELSYVQSVHTGQNLARFVGNQPGNVCFPVYMAEQAKALANEFSDVLTVNVLGEAEMEELGMGCFLSVSKGSEREGQLVTLEYKGASNADAQPVVLVGKGVTFDTGGISIKPGASMDEMKFDMCGSASVLGTIRALCESKLPINVVGALACAENMPSAGATRPGDIVTSMSGQTVEILNTDAEGRLVLCDTLTYIGKFNPAVVVDVATLTGACVIALGHVMTGLFSQDDELANELLTASQTSHDRAWRMPLVDDYQELLDSPCADMQNIGGRPAGSVTAACYLSRFTKDYRWAHLDIAGSAWVSGKNKSATGRPVPMLMQFLRNRAQS